MVGLCAHSAVVAHNFEPDFSIFSPPPPPPPCQTISPIQVMMTRDQLQSAHELFMNTHCHHQSPLLASLLTYKPILI